jgi:hypothetical protein
LRESGLSKAEKLELREHAAEFVKEEDAVEAIWKPKPSKKTRTETVRVSIRLRGFTGQSNGTSAFQATDVPVIETAWGLLT